MERAKDSLTRDCRVGRSSRPTPRACRSTSTSMAPRVPVVHGRRLGQDPERGALRGVRARHRHRRRGPWHHRSALPVRGHAGQRRRVQGLGHIDVGARLRGTWEQALLRAASQQDRQLQGPRRSDRGDRHPLLDPRAAGIHRRSRGDVDRHQGATNVKYSEYNPAVLAFTRRTSKRPSRATTRP